MINFNLDNTQLWLRRTLSMIFLFFVNLCRFSLFYYFQLFEQNISHSFIKNNSIQVIYNSKYISKLFLMNFSKFWKATALAVSFAIPLGTYSLKSREGQLWVWGSGRNGELGLGQQSNMSLPQSIKNHKFSDISAGRAISAAITSDGKLYTWGKNRNGILGHQPPNLNVLLPKLVNSIDKVVQVSCGSEHICAVTQSGDAYIWGANNLVSSFRKIGTSQTTRETLTDVKPTKIQVANVKQVSCAGEYTTLVDKNGRVFVLGTSKVRGVGNKYGKSSSDLIQLDIKDKISRVQSGLNYSIALTEQGKVYVWGNNNFGQLGTGSLKSLSQPYAIDALESQKIVDISCGDNFSGAITQNGDVYTWGFGNEGQLGHGDKSDQPLPRKIQINQKVQKISCGGAHAALLTAQGKLYMMGRGREGQLGRFFNNEGNTGNSLKIEPVEQLPNNKKISQVSCGGTHTLVLLEDL